MYIPITGKGLSRWSCGRRSSSEACTRLFCGWRTPSSSSISSTKRCLACCMGFHEWRRKRRRIAWVNISQKKHDNSKWRRLYLSLSSNILSVHMILKAVLELRLSTVRPASEEAMTVLEEVIMFTFQQCIYYLTKVSVFLLWVKCLLNNPSHFGFCA